MDEMNIGKNIGESSVSCQAADVQGYDLDHETSNARFLKMWLICVFGWNMFFLPSSSSSHRHLNSKKMMSCCTSIGQTRAQYYGQVYNTNTLTWSQIDYGWFNTRQQCSTCHMTSGLYACVFIWFNVCFVVDCISPNLDHIISSLTMIYD